MRLSWHWWLLADIGNGHGLACEFARVVGFACGYEIAYGFAIVGATGEILGLWTILDCVACIASSRAVAIAAHPVIASAYVYGNVYAYGNGDGIGFSDSIFDFRF